MSDSCPDSKKLDDTVEDQSDQMDDLWSGAQVSAQSPNAATSAAAPPCSTAESNGSGTSKRANNELACVEVSKKGRRNRSPYWAYFDKLLVNGLQRAVCKYCARQIGCDPRYGTSVLKNHIERCKGNPPKLNHQIEQCDFSSPLPPTPATPATPVSPISATAIVPWDKFPAAVTVYQMMDTMERLKMDPFAYGSSNWSLGAGEEGDDHRTARTPWAIRESEASYKMRFDVPGFTKKDVSVWVERNMLHLKAEKVSKRCNACIASCNGCISGEDVEWPAESYGKYISKITMPGTVNAQNVMAEVKDGVLYITIPKVRATSRQRVDINVQ